MSASKIMKTLGSLLGVVLLLAPALAMAADFQMDDLKPGITQTSQDQYLMHTIVLWIVTVVGIAVFAVMIYSIIFHRKSVHPKPATFHESTKVEIIWTVLPLLVLVAIAVPATTQFLAQEDLSNPDIEIKVTASQWKWDYEYLGVANKAGDGNLKYESRLNAEHYKAKELNSGVDVTTFGDTYLLEVGENERVVVPVNKKVKLLITSQKVIHAWWVPALGVKRDAVPGKINAVQFTAKETGIHRGQCAELCGKDHGFMPIVVEVVSEKEYADWTVAQADRKACNDDEKVFTKDQLMAKGEVLYASSCQSCHQADGAGIPGVFPALTNSPVVNGDISGHLSIVVNGKGTGMPAFKSMCKADIAAMVTYERNALGNSVGDFAQPTDVNK